jgi:hypothetical protein
VRLYEQKLLAILAKSRRLMTLKSTSTMTLGKKIYLHIMCPSSGLCLRLVFASNISVTRK